jgi:hypothetical protein
MNMEAPPTPAAISAWITHEEHLLDVTLSALSPLEAERNRIEDRLRKLRELLSAYELAGAEPRASSRMAPSEPKGALRPAQRAGGIGEDVRGKVEAILGDAGGEMHILDIYQEFVARGWWIPGAGKAANITAHLTHATGIVSPKRGYYRNKRPDELTTTTGSKQRPARRGKKGTSRR